MHDEFTARQRAIALRLSGRPVRYICQALGRSDFWFRKWWRRYLESGIAGLYDLTRANHHVAQRIPPELESLGVRPLPCERTIERVLERNNLTAPRVHLAALLPRQEWPGPQARASNELHEVDLVGPVYLRGRGHRYYIWVGKAGFPDATFRKACSPAGFPPAVE